ncbi:MAG: Ig-like domain-containing protein, partial [Oscillospiraceae bacterium]|nr:Ig-like domain-containing protein [Oscillospiraceae bacterium]
MRMKQITALVTALVMALSVCPFAALGAELTPATETHEYRTTFDVFKTDNMCKYSSAPAGKTWWTIEGLRARAYGDAIYNQQLMGYNATVSVDRNGNPYATPFEIVDKSKTDDWEWVTDYASTLCITRNHNAIYQNFAVANYGKSSGNFLMLRLNVPSTGKYTLSIDGNRKANYAAPAVYFFKDNGEVIADKSTGYALFSQKQPIGYTNFGDTLKTSGYIPVAAVDVATAGDYFVVLYPDAKALELSTANGLAYQDMELRGIKLSPYDEGDFSDVLRGIELSIGEKLIEVGKSTEITAIGSYSQSGKVEITSGITYTSSDDNIATVNSATGVVTGVGKGTAVITAAVGEVTQKISVEVIPQDNGNAGVELEYRTGWKALSGDKLPTSTVYDKYYYGTYSREIKNNRLIMNYALMHRNATASIDKDEQEVEAWNVMDSAVTAPWDMAFETSPGGVRIQKTTDNLYINWDRTYNGNTEKGNFLALRTYVSNKGTYRLYIDSANVAHGVVPAVYFAYDDGTVTNKNGIYNIVKNSEPIGYHSFAKQGESGYIKLGEVTADKAGDYFIIFYCDAKSSELNTTTLNDDGKSQEMYLNGIRLSAKPGKLEKLELGIPGIEYESDPIPVFTKKKLDIRLLDASGMIIDEIDESKLTVTYKSSDESVATVDDGVISALKTGVSDITVKVEYDGGYAEKTYKLNVELAGKNLMENSNPGFDSEAWLWDSKREDTALETPKFQRTGIVTEESGNRALAFMFDGRVAANGIPDPVSIKNDGSRIAVKPGYLYQLSFKMKADYVNAPDAKDLLMYFDVYAYNNPTGTATDSIAYNAGRSMDLSKVIGWRDKYSEWCEVTVPLAAPSDAPYDTIYLAPRIAFRPDVDDRTKAGYDGMVMFDDFCLREVGYAGVDVEIIGETTNGGSSVTVRSKPYTTLGHYISLGDGWETKSAVIETGDEHVIGAFKNTALKQSAIGSGMYHIDTTATLGGKNASTEVTSTVTIGEVTHSGKCEVTAAGFPIKLLYAEAQAREKTVPAGGSTQIIPTGYLSDGKPADMTDGIISYKSLTPAIASVDSTGKVTALGAGKAKIQVSFMLDGSGAQAIADLTVTDESKIASATLSGPSTVGYLRDEKLILKGLTEDGYPADISAAEVKWTVQSNPIGGVVVTDDGYVFGQTEGAVAEIYAIVSLNGGTAETDPITVTVGETDLRDFLIDFRTASSEKPADVKISEDKWEIDLKKSFSNVAKSYFSTMGLTATTTDKDQDFVINVDIPYEGIYSIILTGSYETYNAEYGDIYVDGIYIGNYDYYDGRNANAEPKVLRTVHLTADKHEFIFRTTKKGPLGGYQIIKELRFKAVKAFPSPEKIVTEKDSYVLAPQSTAEPRAELVLSDGYTYEWQKKYDGEADPFITVTYRSDNDTIASVSDDGVITAQGTGETTVYITAASEGGSITKEIPVKVTENSNEVDDGTITRAEITSPYLVMSLGSDGIDLFVEGFTRFDNTVDISSFGKVWESSDESVATVDNNGHVIPVSVGQSEITVTVTPQSGEPVKACATVSVRGGKVTRTYYTDDMVKNARDNIAKYSWASDMKKTAIEKADRYVGIVDTLYNLIPTEGVPRSVTVGYRSDPERIWCRFCGKNLYTDYADYPWIVDAISYPWKVQCPDCKRRFPTNDFGKFYELGLKNGVFDRQRALDRHHEMLFHADGSACEHERPVTEKTNEWYEYYGYGVKGGFLCNDSYSELDNVTTLNCGRRLGANETEARWGVDDGLGYATGYIYPNGTEEIHTYVSYYNHMLWYNVGVGGAAITDAINSLAEAYIYTDDEKYGRAGAILVDRIADVYPDYDLRPYLTRFSNSDGGSKEGKIIGAIWETFLTKDFAKAYDAFFPMYDREEVVSYIADKAREFRLSGKADAEGNVTAETIRKNIEDGILREIYKACRESSSNGNFGMHQAGLAIAAAVLDTYPDTEQMFDWITQYSETDYVSYNTGGGLNHRLINDVSRDGQGNESAPSYNRIWVTQLIDIANLMERYPGYTGKDLKLFDNPKYISMIKSYAPLTLVRRGVASIGDTGKPGAYMLYPDNDSVMIDSFNYTGDIEIAQHLYFKNDGELDGLHYDIFTENPERLKDEVYDIIEAYGEYNYDKSSMLTGYGFGALRAGTLYESVGTNVIRDTQRDFWMYFGGAESHNHEDKLNLGIEAYGMPMTVELGYPEHTGSDPNRIQWQNATISHNAVVVNEQTQLKSEYPHKPLHFDAKDTRVKVMDVDASAAYTATDEYRRTIVMVDYDSEVSYGIDFFKVRGGDDHLYSFHASSDTAPVTSDNLRLEAQLGGSYAGANVPFGEDPYGTNTNSYNILKYPIGYTWLFNIRRADNPGTGEFWIDYKIKDFRKLSRNDNTDIRLRMTMVNDWNADEVTLANGMPPRTPDNLSVMDHLEYMLVRRKGRDLNTLFTTVIEPYNGTRYIKEIKKVEISSAENTGTDSATAVKVVLADGRIDYIAYAQNNNVTYTVTDSETGYSFDFRGFVGVWTVRENTDKTGFDNVYSYINDGDLIGDGSGNMNGLDAAIKGTITAFNGSENVDDALSFENWIEVKLDCAVPESGAAFDEFAKLLEDRMLVAEKKTYGNSAYVIKGVDRVDDERVRLNLGNVSLIDSYKDDKNKSLGYNFDVEKGQAFEIALSYEDNNTPLIACPEGVSTTAGSSVTVNVTATSNVSDGYIEYKARQLPRGASLDTVTGKFTWRPDASQVGENLVAVDATDSLGRTATRYFTIMVYGSTTGTPSTDDDSTDSTDTPSGGGGGGGGGAAPAPDTDENVGDDDESLLLEEKVPSEGEADEVENGDTTNLRFTDLTSHAWAEDAINELAEKGIIKGTSETTFSPAS